MPRRARKLPSGFEVLDSGSIRVRIRVQGHEPAAQVFPLFGNSAEDRNQQMVDAQAWAATKRREMLGGAHTSSREAARTTLGDALTKYMDEGLRGKETNAQKDRNRIRQIMGDPIAKRSVASLTDIDLAAYGDFLVERAKKANGAAPARTTITNKLGLITRALNHLRLKMHGVPRLRAGSAPEASPGRERRPSAEEMETLLGRAEAINPILPTMVLFATTTALRRERILEFRLKYIHQIGKGAKVIRFPRNRAVRNKRTGVIPLTRQLQSLIDDAVAMNGWSSDVSAHNDTPLFQINGNTFDHQWRRAVLAAKISDLHFHDLRHEATSRLFESGLTAIEVMSITGHSTTEMLDRYSHYSSALILEKLESGLAAKDVASEVRRLLTTFRKQGGNMPALKEAVEEALLDVAA